MEVFQDINHTTKVLIHVALLLGDVLFGIFSIFAKLVAFNILACHHNGFTIIFKEVLVENHTYALGIFWLS